MVLLVPNVGEALLLKRALNYTAADNPVLRLYTNNYTPVEASIAGSFTEASGNGYAAIELTGSSFTVTTDGSGVTTASYAEQTFTFTGGPVSIYGYYVTDNAGTVVLWAEKFSAVQNIPVDGGEVRITVNLSAE